MPDPMGLEHYPWGTAPGIDELAEAFHEPHRGGSRFPHPAEPDEDETTPCPHCGEPPQLLHWFWFQSPDETWELLCGRAGWAAWCPRCEAPVTFYANIMS